MTADLVKAAGGKTVPPSAEDSYMDDIQINVKPIRQKKARRIVVTHAVPVLTHIRH
jgi:hypothetical protein